MLLPFFEQKKHVPSMGHAFLLVVECEVLLVRRSGHCMRVFERQGDRF